MNTKAASQILEEVVASLDIPPSAYEKAQQRYHDVGEWFNRPESASAAHDPHIYPQGSFRLGTVIRPLNEEAGYDLDMGCRLRRGVTKSSHTQKELKNIVGDDLEEYRIARQIENDLEEMHRCWRLPYKDKLSFHIDAVPSIPEDIQRRQMLKEAMTRSGVDSFLADSVANHAGAITDDRDPNYEVLSLDWRISNSEGFARWFESRMKLATRLMEKRAADARVAQIDQLPAREWKSPLQQIVQILKRHRDVMYKDDTESQPISVILTTLAARSYKGEVELSEGLERVLSDMGNHVSPSRPRVPNPVNPSEDFADKWYALKYRHLNLEENFLVWLEQARADFHHLTNSSQPQIVAELALRKFASVVSQDRLREVLGLAAPAIVTAPKTQVIHQPAKPWAAL